MQKKLQVFVSSTYVDLKDERQAAVAGILLAGHIPAGMELFTAGDDAQWEVIKRWIKESDVYMLILGARYGSIEPKSGRSYTELEYDYAAELGKPRFAVVMAGDLYQARKVGQDQQESPLARSAYEAFRTKVLGKISSQFENADQIKLAILGSLRDIADRPNLVGWIRSTDVSDVQPVIEELAKVQAERDELRSKLAEAGSTPLIDGKSLADLNDPVQLTISAKTGKDSSSRYFAFTSTWREIFAAIAPMLVEFPNDARVNDAVAERLYKIYQKAEPYTAKVADDSWGTVRIQFQALELVELKYLPTVGGGSGLFWHATPAGIRAGIAVRAVYR